ncbi:MAG TPA: alpha/beta fold hydrolase [Gemmatimonadales bacterium]|nr:alpha/beta fold hydrolase [Gemmatimonadales bacterium]
MATANLIKRSIRGTLGDLLIDIRSSDRTVARPAVLVLHGFKGFKDWGMFPRIAERLARAGFSVVSPNLSGSGVDDAGEFSLPERFGHNSFSAELEDVALTIDALLQGELGVHPPSSLGLVGHSRGGGVAILQTARDSRVNALVTWSAISTVERWPVEQRRTWRAAGRTDIKNARTGQILPLYTDVLDDIEQNRSRLDIQAAAGMVTVPWLIVHGTQDESVAFGEAKLLESAGSGSSVRLLPVEGGGHTFGAVHPWTSSTPQLDVVFDATTTWLTSHLT